LTTLQHAADRLNMSHTQGFGHISGDRSFKTARVTAHPLANRPVGPSLAMIYMSTGEVILDAVCRLVSQRHVLPSLDAVAAEAGISKGGLIHHFRSRAALLEGVVDRELDRVDAALTEAADRGSAARTWLELALPDTELIEVYRAMDIVLKAPAPAAPCLRSSLSVWPSGTTCSPPSSAMPIKPWWFDWSVTACCSTRQRHAAGTRAGGRLD
jgi:Bacterial regulatory proteins, tetR family